MRRVVLIEDSLDAHNYVRDHAPADWEMLEAADGLSGLDLVRQWLPALDLVILDMMLPDVDGEYVCAQILRVEPDIADLTLYREGRGPAGAEGFSLPTGAHQAGIGAQAHPEPPNGI